MKKVLALILAATMLATFGISAFAADQPQDLKDGTKSGTAVVKVDENSLDDAEWWVVQIPADKTITWGTTTPVNMSYKVASQLANGKTIDVTVSGASALSNDAISDKIPYTPAGFEKQNYPAVNGTGTVSDPVYVNAKTDVTLTIDAAAWNGIPVAVYQDTLTYTVTVNNAA